MANDRLYLSFGVAFFSDDWDCMGLHPPYTNAFLWMRTLRAELLRKPLASVSGFFTDRRSLELFGGDPAFPFLSVMASSVYDASASIPRSRLPDMVHGVYAPTGWHE